MIIQKNCDGPGSPAIAELRRAFHIPHSRRRFTYEPHESHFVLRHFSPQPSGTVTIESLRFAVFERGVQRLAQLLLDFGQADTDEIFSKMQKCRGSILRPRPGFRARSPVLMSQLRDLCVAFAETAYAYEAAYSECFPRDQAPEVSSLSPDWMLGVRAELADGVSARTSGLRTYQSILDPN